MALRRCAIHDALASKLHNHNDGTKTRPPWSRRSRDRQDSWLRGMIAACFMQHKSQWRQVSVHDTQVCRPIPRVLRTIYIAEVPSQRLLPDMETLVKTGRRIDLTRILSLLCVNVPTLHVCSERMRQMMPVDKSKPAPSTGSNSYHHHEDHSRPSTLEANSCSKPAILWRDI